MKQHECVSEGLEEPGECEQDKLLLECLVRDEAGGDGSELTKGLCAQLSNVVLKAEGSPGRVSSRGVAPRSPWHQQEAQS